MTTEQRQVALERARSLRTLMETAPLGPWESVQMEGFGATRFLVTQRREHTWSRVVATIENCCFDGGAALARTRTDVPAMADDIEALAAALAAAEAHIEKLETVIQDSIGTGGTTARLLAAALSAVLRRNTAQAVQNAEAILRTYEATQQGW